MRHLKSIFTLLLMLAAPTLAIAEQKEGSKPRPPITLEKKLGHGHFNRPKAPDRQSITCTYDGLTMELNFTISEGIASLTVTDETPQYLTYSVDTSTLYVSVPVGSLYGSINIELDTERGNHFEGTLP